MKKSLLLILLCLSVFSAKSQFVVTAGGNAAAVASAIGGAGLTISNVTINCKNTAYGSFTGGAASGMGMSGGLMLTTGNVADLPGTGNTNDDYDFCVGAPYNFSDPQLTALSSSATKDVCVIEFDVVPKCTNMGITFVFGSDEYTNWVNQTFNDAFGFFVSGPNPGGGNYNNVNIATIPGGTNVSVDNVNNGTNSAYFVDNNSGTYANHFDGFTTVLSPSIAVTPCATYHFKLAIADATDCAMDSGVLIDVIQCNNVMTLSTTNTPATACGLNNGTATVTVTNGLAPLTYVWSPAPGAGQGTPNATGLTAGTTYTVTVDDNYACIAAVTATTTIGGPVAPTVAVNSATVCAGVSTTLTATTSGSGTYSWTPGGAVTNAITVTPSITTTYTCSYTLSGCTGTGTGTVTVNQVPIIASVAPVCSDLAPFNLSVDVAGGTWSGTGITSAGNGTFNPALVTGTSVITYTAPGSCIDTIHIMVIPSGNPAWTQPAPMCVVDAPINLNSFVTGTAGGTWSGTGVTGNTFDPTGLSGNISVTYTVGTAPCTHTQTHDISVSPNVPPTINSVSTQCANAAPFNLTADFSGGTWSGTGITNASAGTFDPSMASIGNNQIIYMIAGSCAGSDTINISVLAVPDSTWTVPAAMCANNGTVNLDLLITGTTGGTWSGNGVTGNMFDPSGLSGNIPVTYSVGTTCVATSTQNITVIPNSDASWTTTAVCASSGTINLDSLVTGTSGGTWAGTGVTGSSFNPSGLSGNISVTYTVGTSPCQAVSTQNINVVPASDPSWTDTTLCSAFTPLDLNTLLTGTAGGTWTGNGITGNTFDPNGLSGAIAVTYTVGPVGCQFTSTQNVTVVPSSTAAWTTTSLCANSGAINLDALVTGTTGGTWSGTGVTGSSFNPSGLSGPIAVTYTVGTAPCIEVSTQNINVTPASDPSWTTSTLCASNAPVDLNTYITGTTGGTWSGTGVNGSMFDPNGLSGAIAVTYTVGPVGCQYTLMQNITVIPSSDPSWTTTTLCQTGSVVNLNSFVTGTTGGSWSGSGVTGSSFNPSGLSGNISVTYTVGTSPCQSVSTQDISVVTPSNPAWTTTSLCANAGPLDLTTLVTGTTGGTWSGTGVSGTFFNPAGLSGPISVTYTVSNSPCSSSSTQSITVIPGADATVNPVSSMCTDYSPVTLTALNSGGTWSGTGITNQTAGTFDPAVATAGSHVITYTIGGACPDSDNMTIIVNPLPSAAFAPPAKMCEYANPFNLNTSLTGTSGGTWSGNGVTGSTFDPADVSGSSSVVTYSVTQNGCTSSSTQTIVLDPIHAAFTATPEAGLSPLSVDVINNSTLGSNCSWDFGNGATSNTTNASTVYTGMGTYEITLLAINSTGCRDSVKVAIVVDEISALVIPNVFSPNGDGHNDVFKPVVAESLLEFKAVIYDRWGLKLYEWSDEDAGWDGTAKNGRVAPDGTYFYIVTGKGVHDKPYEMKGYVQLFGNK
jgi:gliding motility-associated-like protein